MKIPVICKKCGKDFLKSLAEIKRMEQIGYKNHFCSNQCSRDYNLYVRKNIIPAEHRKKYYYNPKRCPQCKSVIPFEHKENIYCSQKCGAIYTQKDGGHCHWSDDDKKRISKWAKKNAYRSPKTGIDEICPICSSPFYKRKSSKRICCSKKCSVEWINKTGYLKGKCGGYREKGGRGKQGWYKGYYCNSSWELAWVIYQLEHNISFVRNTEGFQYDFNGEKYKFYPDFIMNNEYIEIKAYIDKKNAAKISSFPHKLNVIGKNDISPFIEYAEQKYGKDYVKLYEPKEKSF